MIVKFEERWGAIRGMRGREDRGETNCSTFYRGLGWVPAIQRTKEKRGDGEKRRSVRRDSWKEISTPRTGTKRCPHLNYLPKESAETRHVPGNRFGSKTRCDDGGKGGDDYWSGTKGKRFLRQTQRYWTNIEGVPDRRKEGRRPERLAAGGRPVVNIKAI